jgi:hypothetical protein
MSLHPIISNASGQTDPERFYETFAIHAVQLFRRFITAPLNLITFSEIPSLSSIIEAPNVGRP